MIGRPPAPRVVCVANQKGGVGKTTSTVNVAAALAQEGWRVLVIDLDPQGNASTALGMSKRAKTSIYDCLVNDVPLEEVLQESSDIEGLACAPATIDLAGAEIELVSIVAREFRMQRALKDWMATAGKDFDLIMLDCPPSLGLLTLNALVASDEILIPIQCEYYALEGLGQLLRTVEMVRKHLNPELRVSSILLTMHDMRTRLSAQVVEEVRAHFGPLVMEAVVPRSVRISEAPSHGQTAMTYEPASSGAQAYRRAAIEFGMRITAESTVESQTVDN